jgi:hypothetical protein
MRRIVKDKNNNEYVYVHFIGEGTHYLIPYIDLPNIGKKYWEYHFVPKDTWILINKNTNFDNFNISKDDFNELIQKDKDSYKEILKKYHNSF